MNAQDKATILEALNEHRQHVGHLQYLGRGTGTNAWMPDAEKQAKIDQAIAAVEAWEEWEPVVEYRTGHKYGGMLIVGARIELWDEEAIVVATLPDNIRLYRRKETP
jgi:hypothetical protein